MASPANVGFTCFDAGGAPLSGLTPTFLVYKDETGTNISAPSITAVGGGNYTFTPQFTVDHCASYLIDCGATAVPRYQFGFLRPEDFQSVWDETLLDHIDAGTMGEYMRIGMQVAQGRIKIDAIAGTLTVYQEDESSVLFTRDLRLADGTTHAGLDAVNRSGS